MRVEIRPSSTHHIVIRLEGDFDSFTAAGARERIEAIVATTSGDPIVDLSGVEFLDSAGAGALVYLHKKLIPQNRSLSLIGVAGQPFDLMELLRLSEVFSINQISVNR